MVALNTEMVETTLLAPHLNIDISFITGPTNMHAICVYSSCCRDSTHVYCRRLLHLRALSESLKVDRFNFEITYTIIKSNCVVAIDMSFFIFRGKI